jgi:hypothetical protein
MTLADEINRMILKIVESLEITSANPTHTNTVIQANQLDTPDLEAMIKEDIGTGGGNQDDDVILKKVELLIKNKTGSKTETKKLDDMSQKIESWDKGAVGEINKMTSAQLSNFKSFMTNPSGFIIQIFMSKFAKGAGVLALAFIISEAVKALVLEMMKPGRLLDIRFRRNIKEELLQFQRREDQQKLKQGFRSVIITSMPSMRGSANQASQTVYSLDLTRTNSFPATVGFDPLNMQSSGMDMKIRSGRKRFRE